MLTKYGDQHINITPELKDWVKQFVDKDGNLDLEKMDHGDARIYRDEERNLAAR